MTTLARLTKLELLALAKRKGIPVSRNSRVDSLREQIATSLASGRMWRIIAGEKR